MTKKLDYISKLKKILKRNRVENIDDIIEDVNELFNAKLAEGKSEGAIIKALGTPDNVAKLYIDENKQKPMKKSSKVKLAFIGICSVFAMFFVVAAILIGVGVVNFTSELDKSITASVYLESSQTDFKDDYITITLKNVSDTDFEDQVIHLIYLNTAGDPVGVAYSEQKVETIGASSTKTIIFKNPGWSYSEYNEIYACIQSIENHSNWTRLKNGREFSNYRQVIDEFKTYIVIFESVFAFLLFAVDLILIANVVVLRKKNSL